jgi:hypothetical protein
MSEGEVHGEQRAGTVDPGGEAVAVDIKDLGR